MFYVNNRSTIKQRSKKQLTCRSPIKFTVINKLPKTKKDDIKNKDKIHNINQ